MRFSSLLLLAAAFSSSYSRAALASSPSAQDSKKSAYTVRLPTAEQSSPRVGFVVSLTPTDAKPGASVTLSVKAMIQPGWHISAVGHGGDDSPSLPTSILFKSDALMPIGEAFSPSVEPTRVKLGDATHLQHSGVLTWTRQYRVAADAGAYSGIGSIGFQVCDEEKCLPPARLEFALGGSLEGNVGAAGRNKPVYKTIGEPLLVALTATALKRDLINTSHLVTADPQKDFDKYIEQMMAAMNETEALSLGGVVELEGESVRLYLADQEQYSLVNTNSDETRFGNTSTYLSIDHNGDGKIVDYESVATNLPIRLFDSMFLVTDISKERKVIELQQIDVPLSGAVLNRRCPDFTYETVEGKVVSNESLIGKVTILDVWAVT